MYDKINHDILNNIMKLKKKKKSCHTQEYIVVHYQENSLKTLVVGYILSAFMYLILLSMLKRTHPFL
jgi:hypothetical protein